MRVAAISLCVVALAVSGAAAQTMLADFESGNPFSGGTVVADPENAAIKVLYVASGTVTLDLAAALAPGEGIAMRVYDQGLSALDNAEHTGPAEDSRPGPAVYGWNLGVAGTYTWGVVLLNKSYLGGNAGYGWTGNQYGPDFPMGPTSIWSMDYYGGPRQADALSIIGTGTIANPQVPGDGKWSTWTFTFNPDGSMSAANDGIPNPALSSSPAGVESAITRIYVASHTADMGEVWVDDVRIVTGGTCNPGDADGDGDVDLDDFVILKNNFGTATGATCAQGDFDGDGDVDLDDFVLLKNNFGATY